MKRESQTLCEGPPTEAEYLTRVSQGKEPAPAQAAARPGQDQLEETISDFDKRLEALKKKLKIDLDNLTAQLEKATQFQDILAELLSWVTEAEGELESLKISDPQSVAIEKQQQRCQVTIATKHALCYCICPSNISVCNFLIIQKCKYWSHLTKISR